MRSEVAEKVVEGLRLAISNSYQLFLFLEDNAESIRKEDVETLQELTNRIEIIKSSLVTMSGYGALVGITISKLLEESYDYAPNEAQALGILKEVQISRHLGFCSLSTLSRITRLFARLEFPTRMSRDHMNNISLSSKSDREKRKFPMMKHIGQVKFAEINDKYVDHVLESGVCVVSNGPVFGSIIVPGSKSISNRVLLLAALGQGICEIEGLLDSDDIQYMLRALRTFGVKFEWKNNGETLVIEGRGGKFSPVIGGEEIFLGNSGTSSRFLTSTATLVPVESQDGLGIILTGDSRMKERPIGPLVEALRANGCHIEYMESQGSLPIAIGQTGLEGGVLNLEAKVSSQYVSSILMTAPYARTALQLRLAEESPTSLPYILMTLELMKSFGVEVEFDGRNNFTVPIDIYTNPSHLIVEPDASSATYALAIAAITGGDVRVPHLGSGSVQGDAKFLRVLEVMGCFVEQTEEKTRVRGPMVGKLKGVELNMGTLTDAFMTVAVLGAVAEGRTVITGIENQRVKECNRIKVMVEELSKIGVTCGELDDGIWIQGLNLSEFKTPASITCHDDHRIALSFAVLGAKVPGIFISDKETTAKTYPGFWDDCRQFLQMELCTTPEVLSNQNQVPTIFLVGMRGSGKSTFGRLCAAALGLGFLCMDDRLEADFGCSIASFVNSYGWRSFRIAEEKLLFQIMDNLKYGIVVSCGGGIIETPGCFQKLSGYKFVIHFQRDENTLRTYLEKDKSRPKFAEPFDVIWARRKPLYQKCSKFEFSVHDETGEWETLTNEFSGFMQKIFTQMEKC